MTKNGRNICLIIWSLRRFDQDVTLAILRIEGDACSVERIDIGHETPRRKVPAKVPVRFYVIC